MHNLKIFPPKFRQLESILRFITVFDGACAINSPSFAAVNYNTKMEVSAKIAQYIFMM